jgi:uncharacterized protein with FMN-binding domain
VVATMSGVSLVVVGLGWRASAPGSSGHVAQGVVATGVVSLPSPSASPSSRPRTAVTTKTVNGGAADTRYGPVQVQITVRSKRIVSADAIVYPTGGRDGEINSVAVPALDDETLQSQSATIDTVSGATYTSEGYRESLQSAIDAAHSAGLL